MSEYKALKIILQCSWQAEPATDYAVFNISHKNYRCYLFLDLSKRKAKFYGQDNNNFLSSLEIQQCWSTTLVLVVAMLSVDTKT